MTGFPSTRNFLRMESIFQTFGRHCSHQGERPVLIDAEGEFPWSLLMHTVNSACLGLVYHGLRTGRGVALLLRPNRYQILAPLAVLRGRGILVPLNPALGPGALQKALRRSAPEILLYDPYYRELIAELESQRNFRGIVELGSAAPQGRVSWADLVSTETAGAAYPEINPDTTAVHLHSLTAERTLRSVVASTRNLLLSAHSTLRRNNFTAADRHLSLGTSAGEASLDLLPALISGGCQVLGETLNPRQIFALTQQQRVSVLRVPPFLCRTLAEWQQATGESLSTVRVIECPGPAPRATMRMAKSVFKEKIAFTRTHPFALGALLGPKVVAGTLRQDQPCPGYVLQVTGVDGVPTLSDEVGELWIKGNLLVQSTLEDSGKVLIPRTNGWFRSGTQARNTMAGEVALLGTAEDTLVRGGVTVILRECELCLEDHPRILEAICLKLKDPLGKELIIALVHLDSEGSVSSDELTEWLRHRRHPAELPNQILITSRFPHLPGGEVDRIRLQRHLQDVLLKKS